MNIKKLITIIFITVTIFAAAFLIVINVNFFKEISSVSPEPKERPTEEEETELNYVIPSTTIPTGQITETAAAGIIEKRKVMREKELESERIRGANRAEAFARQKELEVSLMHAEIQEPQQAAGPSLPKKYIEPPSAEEIKAMEKKGIISY